MCWYCGYITKEGEIPNQNRLCDKCQKMWDENRCLKCNIFMGKTNKSYRREFSWCMDCERNDLNVRNIK